MNNMNLASLSIRQAHDGLRAGDFTAVDLVTAVLSNIEQRNPEINAYITVVKEDALRQAALADEALKAGTANVLTGIPFGVKDAICIAGVKATGSATILDEYVPPYTATVITRLLDHGAILVGKQNCDAFGHGASNENSMYGPVKNPHNVDKVAGGSSGGSSAALAADMCLFSVAEDTGGSIRQPASFCGVVGMRPSYGRNSRYGIMPMASSLDTVGVMTRTVEDLALLQEIMAGADPKDATCVPDRVPDYTKALNDLPTLTIGIPSEYFAYDGMDGSVKEQMQGVIDALKAAGHTIKDVSLPHTKYAVPAYYIIVPSEDSSNLARLDGIRYGNQQSADTLTNVYTATRTAGFPAEVKRRIMIGTYALSAGYIDAYYKKAQQARTLIKQDFDHVFEHVDVLLTPTAPTTAFALGSKKDDILSMYLADVFVAPAALAGVPALSVPVGFDDEGLPIGAQLVGPRLREDLVFQAGKIVEDLVS